jgi:hypothetical protein
MEGGKTAEVEQKGRSARGAFRWSADEAVVDADLLAELVQDHLTRSIDKITGFIVL